MSDNQQDHESHELSPAEQAAVERALSAARPMPPRIDRDRLMFLAGAASVVVGPEPHTLNPETHMPAKGSGFRVQRSWHWPAATAAFAATSLALAAALIWQPPPAERIVYVPRPLDLTSAPAPHLDADSTSNSRLLTPDHATPDTRNPTPVHQHNYLRTRTVALRLGLDALGVTPVSEAAAQTPTITDRGLLEGVMLPRRPGLGERTESSQM